MTARTEVLVGAAPGARVGARARRLALSAWAQELLAMVATVALLVGAALFYVFQHLQVVRLGYEVERLRGEQATVVEQGRALSLEAAGLRAVKRVEAVARGRLGMVAPAPGQVTVVR